MTGNKFRCSCQGLSISVSTSLPRHPAINAIAGNSLSGRLGAGPGHLKKGAIFSQILSVAMDIQAKKNVEIVYHWSVLLHFGLLSAGITIFCSSAFCKPV
jgi:hypothetical protein